MTQQCRKFVHILTDESRHGSIDRDDAPPVHQRGKGVGILSVHEQQVRLNLGRASNAQVRQKYFLYGLLINA